MKNLLLRSHPKIQAHLLVIEDNADHWFLIDWALSRSFPEVKAVWKQTDLEAISYLESCLKTQAPLPELILLDLYLPVAEVAWNVLEMLKTHHIFREIPVVILSHSKDKGDIRESYMFRANSYIIKPTSHEEWQNCFNLFRQYWHQIVALPEPV